MAAGFSVQPEKFEEAAEGLQSHGQDLAAVWEGFKGQVESITEASGGDEIGGLIMEIHNVILGAFEESITVCADELANAGADLKEWATAHAEGDEAVAKIFQQLLDGLGG
ncbi:hypothetical protein [Glycomyces albidus]|jgi:hypothetical protein|uniref:PE domain-containing protein n=1 Tax=Glycomyces albidus TaxID=2656774 RepID=A0A6L5G848_9ACTN|nr:hypothetical protein [Glycomyces albidus]MQM25849.1 hypothetical protein [Glycomyces albidus]